MFGRTIFISQVSKSMLWDGRRGVWNQDELDNGGSNECHIILLSKAPVAVTLVLQDCAAITRCVRRLPRGSLIGTHNDRTEALR